MRDQTLVFRVIVFILGFFFFFPFKASASSIVINEIGAAESGSGYEWLEIYNAGLEVVQISDWKFWENNQNHGLTLTQGAEGALVPGEYAIITQDDIKFLERNPGFAGKIFDSSWGSLTNSGENIGLRNSEDMLVEEFTYIAVNNFSLQRRDSAQNIYTFENWTEHISGHTAGEANDFTPAPFVDAPPVARIALVATTTLGDIIQFNASSSTDDVGIILYEWDFGDGEEAAGATVPHTYMSTGTFDASVTVTDGAGNTSTAVLQVTVVLPVVYEKMVINEFVPNPADGGKEWVEIFNTSITTTSLDGWTIEDATGNAIATLGGVINPHGFAGMEIIGSRLNNGGDTITLKRPDGTVSDEIIYGAGGMTVPVKTQAGARLVDGADTDSVNDFIVTITPTFGAANQIEISNTPVEVVTPSAPQEGGSVPPPSFPVRSVVVNEILSNPGDEAQEFVELYNAAGYGIDLRDWVLEDGSGAKTALSGRIEGLQFFVVESPNGGLNNAGDIVRLLDPSGREIDRVVYGGWDDGSKGDNMMAPGQGQSLARKKDGHDTDVDYADFALTRTVTSGQINVIQEVTFSSPTLPIVSTSLRITELYPNPPGSDVKDEFIEIQNMGDAEVTLSGFWIRDSSSKYIFSDMVLPPKGFAVLKREASKIALNNTNGELVSLYEPSGTVTDTAGYIGSAKEGYSYSKQTNGLWAWTDVPTYGAENTVVTPPTGPNILLEFSKEGVAGEKWEFDASDSVGITTNTLEFLWNFGDGSTGSGEAIEHVYTTPGRYEGSVHVRESDVVSSTLTFVVAVWSNQDEVGVGGSFEREGLENIEIISIFPNPTGSDDAEFITLFNPNDFLVDISFFQLDDQDGGSRPYTIPADTIIQAQSSKVFPKSETKLALNNDTDTVRLLYPDGTILRSVRYEKGKEGAVYKSNEVGVWAWESPSVAVQGKKVESVATAVKGAKVVAGNTMNFQSSLRVGQQVTVRGVVSVLPGVFGTQYFYIQNTNTSTLSGVQVYMNSKDFPELAVGNLVTVSGETSEVSGEKRVKVRTKGDIKVLESGAAITPARLSIEQVKSDLVGFVLSLEGEVTEVKSGSLFIDDGTDEIRVSLKQGANINSSSFALGDRVRIAGVLRGREDALELTPRSRDDIEEVKVATTEMLAEVRGEKISASPSINRYVSVALIGLAFAGAGLLLRPRLEFAWKNVKAKMKK